MTAVWAAPKTSNIQPPRLTATGTHQQLVINVSLTLLWHMWKQQLCALQWQVPLIFTEVTFSFSLLEYYLFKRKHEWLSLKLQDGLNVTVNVTDWLIEIVHLDDWLNTFLSKQKWFSAFSVWYNCKWNLLVFWILDCNNIWRCLELWYVVLAPFIQFWQTEWLFSPLKTWSLDKMTFSVLYHANLHLLTHSEVPTQAAVLDIVSNRKHQ